MIYTLISLWSIPTPRTPWDLLYEKIVGTYHHIGRYHQPNSDSFFVFFRNIDRLEITDYTLVYLFFLDDYKAREKEELRLLVISVGGLRKDDDH